MTYIDFDSEATLVSSEQQQQSPIFSLLYQLSEEDKESALSQALARFKAGKAYMEKLYPDMIRQYKKYRSVAEPMRDSLGQEVTGRSNIIIPYVWATVESEMPRLAGRLPKVKAFPRKSPSKVNPQVIQDLIYYSLDRAEYLRLGTLWLRQYEIYGWSPLFYYWRHEMKNVRSRVADGQGNYVMRKEQKAVWDDFALKVLDVFDCYLQPGTTEIEEGDWFIFSEMISAKKLKALVEAGVFYPEVTQYLTDGRHNQPAGSEAGRTERDAIIGITRDLSPHSYGKHELLYILEDEQVTVLLDRCVLARAGDNPHPLEQKPIINCNLMPLTSEPIGVGSVEALGGLPDKLNALSNARMDNISLLMNKVFIANRLARVDADNVRMEAGNIIWTDNMDWIKVLDVPDIAQSSAQEILTTKEEMQFVSGISDFIVGVRSSSRLADTATGVSTIVREANARFALKLATFEAGALRRLVQAVLLYNQTFMPYEKVIYTVGPEGYTTQLVTLDEILCECELLVEPGSTIPLDQLSRRDFLLQLLPNLMPMQQLVDIKRFLKEVFEAGDIRNPDELFLPVSEASPINDAKLAEAENIALASAQPVQLKGNDELHLQVHQPKPDMSPDGLMALQQHVAQHQQRLQQAQLAQQQQVIAQEMQQLQQDGAQPQGGTNGLPNDGGTGATADQTGERPRMDGGTGLPQPTV